LLEEERAVLYRPFRKLAEELAQAEAHGQRGRDNDQVERPIA